VNEIKTPAKKWRVSWGPSNATDYPSQPKAYEALTEWTGRATVYHWKDGQWRLYERIEPATDTAGSEQSRRPNCRCTPLPLGGDDE